MIREIVKFGDPRLRERSEEVAGFGKELWRLLDDMYETMRKADGIGLAAPQLGVLKRVVVIDVGKGRLELINPVIVSMRGSQFEPEGCLSSVGRRGIVKRPMYVKVKAQNRFGKPIKLRGRELLARAFCHEIDHLNGILYEDKVIEWVEEENR